MYVTNCRLLVDGTIELISSLELFVTVDNDYISTLSTTNLNTNIFEIYTTLELVSHVWVGPFAIESDDGDAQVASTYNDQMWHWNIWEYDQ